jgi:hypothetical protein
VCSEVGTMKKGDYMIHVSINYLFLTILGVY